MDDFRIVPPIVIKDTPKPQRLTTLTEARAYVDEAMHAGRSRGGSCGSASKR